MDPDISNLFMGLKKGKNIKWKASYIFLECISLFLQMVTKPEHYAAHHVFTIVGEGKTVRSDQ